MNSELAHQIRAWEKKQEYTEGLRLFRERYGENIRYRSLAKGTSDFNRQKLRELLLDGLPPSPSEQTVKPKTTIANEPSTITEWRKETTILMDERIMLKQRLRDLSDDETEQRKLAAFRILDITERLDHLFGKIRYYETYQRVPEEKAVEENERQVTREYLNLRTYISRETRKLHPECNCDGCARRKQKIETWYLRMKEIETEQQ